MKVRLRNVSAQPIYGIKASLHFEPPGVKMLFGLLMVWTNDLKREPLQPGGEIDLEVSEQSLERTLERMREYGVDANLSSVSFSLDDAYFSDDLKWSRGTLLRRDPYDRYKWSPVNKLPSATARNGTADTLFAAILTIRTSGWLSECHVKVRTRDVVFLNLFSQTNDQLFTPPAT